jgi:hypothetical protein
MTTQILSNGHASALAPCLIYDPEDEDGNMLVACVLVSTSGQMLDALKAHFEKNGGNMMHLDYLDPKLEPSITLTAAGRGYRYAKTNFAHQHASGQARAHLNQLAGDPRSYPKSNYFYVVVETGQEAATQVGERLQLATYHTLLPAWYPWLLAEGQVADLITPLPMRGNHFFLCGYRVSKDNAAWGELVSNGLRAGNIGF